MCWDSEAKVVSSPGPPLDKPVRSNKGTLGELRMTFNHLRMKGVAQAGRPEGGLECERRPAARARFAVKQVRLGLEPRVAAEPPA